MDFHEDLSRLGEKEGLKGRKLNKAVESFTWNITVLKVNRTGHFYSYYIFILLSFTLLFLLFTRYFPSSL